MIQNTDEWRAFRRTKIGASDCPAIMGVSPYKTAYDVWREKVLGEEPFVTYAMQRGTDLEPMARELAQKLFANKFDPEVVTCPGYSWAMASLDGITDDRNVILEIKCPSGMLVMGEVREDWKWQIQHQLAVTGAQAAILMVYRNDTDYYTVDIEPDPQIIEKLFHAEIKFWFDNVCEEVPPELTDRDYLERDDWKWESLAGERRAIEADMAALEVMKENNRKAIINETGGRPCKGFGMKASKYFVRGQVDYKAIPELQGMNLDGYRKPGREQWRIT